MSDPEYIAQIRPLLNFVMKLPNTSNSSFAPPASPTQWKGISCGILARYRTGIPRPLPQSLAKIRLCEFSHAGDELLQSPPTATSVLPLTVSRSQICLGPPCVDSKAVHFPSGEVTEPSVVAGGEGAGIACRAPGSNIMVLDAPSFTNSK